MSRRAQRRDRARIERDIETHLKGRQFLRSVLRFELKGEGRNLTLSHSFDAQALESLGATTLGRVVLMTDRHAWTTAEIIQAYRSQADVEAAFRDMKNPSHLALRPQHHWTDQKIHVHVFLCVLSFLLAKLLLLKAQNAGQPIASIDSLLDRLSEVRRATILRSTDAGGVRAMTMLEEMQPPLAELWNALGVG